MFQRFLKGRMLPLIFFLTLISFPTSDCNEHEISKWAYTSINPIEVSFMWSINNFCVLNQGGNQHTMDSPAFYSGTDDQEEWSLTVNTGNGYLSLSFRSMQASRRETFTRYKFCIIDERGQPNSCSNSLTRTVQLRTSSNAVNLLRISELCRKNYLVPNDTLTIKCELSYNEEVKHTSTPAKRSGADDKPVSDSSSIAEDFQALFESAEFSDIILEVEDKEIRAHKSILAVRSPVFKAMFTRKIDGVRMDRVNITDLGYEDLTQMLLYMYTGRSPPPDRISGGLLVASDKFGVKSLTVKCEEDLVVDVENAAEVLMLADLHSAGILKERAVDFILKNIKKVRKTIGWRELLDSHSQQLLDDLIGEMATKIR